MPAVHPDTQTLLALIRAAGRPPFEVLSPEEARQALAASRAILQPPPDEVAMVHDLAVPGEAGDVRVRVYRGAGTGDDEALPCLLYLHGGGWVLGDLESHDGVCRRLANAASCCVVAVDYRLAPEHRFPAAVEDCASVLAWIAANAGALGIDAGRIAVGGDSAGGNLAAVLALMGRDGLVPAPMFQALLYPAVDLTMSAESYERAMEGLPLTASTMRYFIDHYAPRAADRTDWRASPLRAASLSGTPEALVLTCGLDPLCDEGRRYAERLERDGVLVTAVHLSGQVHGILTMGKVIRVTTSVLDLVASSLRDAWHLAGERPLCR